MELDRRAKIVHAAVALLEKEGPKGFGQVRIARAAGVQQGHLTYYFPTKRDLARAVLEHVQARTQKEFLRVLQRSPELSPEALTDLFFAEVWALMQNKARNRVMLALVAEALEDPEIGKLLEAQLEAQERFVGLLLGRPEDDVDVQLIVAALRGIGTTQLTRPRGAARRGEQVVARLKQLMLAR